MRAVAAGSARRVRARRAHEPRVVNAQALTLASRRVRASTRAPSRAVASASAAHARANRSRRVLRARRRAIAGVVASLARVAVVRNIRRRRVRPTARDIAPRLARRADTARAARRGHAGDVARAARRGRARAGREARARARARTPRRRAGDDVFDGVFDARDDDDGRPRAAEAAGEDIEDLVAAAEDSPYFNDAFREALAGAQARQRAERAREKEKIDSEVALIMERVKAERAMKAKSRRRRKPRETERRWRRRRGGGGGDGGGDGGGGPRERGGGGGRGLRGGDTVVARRGFRSIARERPDGDAGMQQRVDFRPHERSRTGEPINRERKAAARSVGHTSRSRATRGALPARRRCFTKKEKQLEP